jgi:hypothetical protein
MWPACTFWGEFFATMTGRGVEITDAAGNTDRMVFTQNECAVWLRKFADRLKFEELTKDEALSGLDKAQRLGVQGARCTTIGMPWCRKRRNPTNLSRATHATLRIWREMLCGPERMLVLTGILLS